MKLTDDKLTTGSVGGFHFSAVRTDTLGAPEYTLVTLALDRTGSVAPFADVLFKIKQTVVEACRKSPRSDYLLLRVVEFNSGVDEVHGFMPLAEIDVSAYATPHCTGLTALNDAAFAAISATRAYGLTLSKQDYLTNGIVVVVTDGDDNASRTTVAMVADEVKKAVQSEALESLRTVLVGVNTAQLGSALKTFQASAGFDQFVDVADASAAKLAKLFDFVSRSISAQSQSLGTGGPSQALTF